MLKVDVYCEGCRYNYCDDIVEYYECANSEIPEDIMEIHYIKGKCNCPYRKEMEY